MGSGMVSSTTSSAAARPRRTQRQRRSELGGLGSGRPPSTMTSTTSTAAARRRPRRTATARTRRPQRQRPPGGTPRAVATVGHLKLRRLARRPCSDQAGRRGGGQPPRVAATGRRQRRQCRGPAMVIAALSKSRLFCEGRRCPCPSWNQWRRCNSGGKDWTAPLHEEGMRKGRISGCRCRRFCMGKRGTPWWLLGLPAGEHHLLWWPEASIAEKQVSMRIPVRKQKLYYLSESVHMK